MIVKGSFDLNVDFKKNKKMKTRKKEFYTFIRALIKK